MPDRGLDAMPHPGALPREDEPTRLERLLDQTVDVAIAGCLFVVPLAMGGRHPLGHLTLVLLALTAAMAWTLRQALAPRAVSRPTLAAPILLAGAALGLVQILPLPQPLLAKLSPHVQDLLPLWHASGEPSACLGLWSTISLTPAATRHALALFFAYGLVFLVAVQRIRAPGDVERLLRWCAATAGLMAAFGLAQFLTSNGRFFWFYQHPYTDTSDCVKGSFENRNHFAQFLALGVGPLVWWIHDALRRARPSRAATPVLPGAEPQRGELAAYLLVLALGLVLFAGLLSLSRGGFVAMLLAGAIAAAVCLRASAVGSRVAITLGAAAALILTALAIFGYDRVRNRLEELSSGSVERLDPHHARRAIWIAAARGIPKFALFGAGVASHAEVYPLFFPNELRDTDREYTHAESSYLQLGLETGLVGLALALAAVALCALWCLRSLRRAASSRLLACAGAIAGGLAASAAHAIVDFTWYCPACVVMAIVLAAGACRLSRFAVVASDGGLRLPRAACRRAPPSPHRSLPLPTLRRAAAGDGLVLPRAAFAALLAALLPAGAWMVESPIGAAFARPDWDRYRTARMAMECQPAPAIAAAPDQVRGVAREAEQRRIRWLEEVVRWHPANARVHLDLAECCLRLFDIMQEEGKNPMSLGNVRDAALRSRFPSREALDAWLARAVGEHTAYLDCALGHTRRALALSPLQGRAYLYLAELCFLENGGEAAKRAYVEQALLVRPFDGEVLYAAANEALLAGHHDQWLDHARRSFQCGRRHQKRLMADLIGHTPVQALEEMIQLIVSQFQPDLQATRELHALAALRGQPEQLAWLRRHFAEQAETEAGRSQGETAARLWNEARGLHAALGDGPRALACAENSVACDRHSLDARHGLALALMAQGRLAEAEPHLRWCLQHRPKDAAIEAQWKEALRDRLDDPADTAARNARQRRL